MWFKVKQNHQNQSEWKPDRSDPSLPRFRSDPAHSPGHSRRSLLTPSSSSSAGTRSTRSGTWPPRGSGRRSSCGTAAGPGSWPRAAGARWPYTPEAAGGTRRDQKQNLTHRTSWVKGQSVGPRIHFQRHQSQRKATRFWFCLHAWQRPAMEDGGTFGLGCRTKSDIWVRTWQTGTQTEHFTDSMTDSPERDLMFTNKQTNQKFTDQIL